MFSPKNLARKGLILSDKRSAEVLIFTLQLNSGMEDTRWWFILFMFMVLCVYLGFNPLCAIFFQREHKHIFTFYAIPLH